MKHLKKLFLVVCCLAAMFLSACRQNPEVVVTSEEPTVSLPEETPAEEESFQWIVPADTIDIENMTLYWQHNLLYFVADDSAKLSLYVAAETDENGTVLFDDGQDWTLIMETSLGNYPLFPRQYVQLGGVSCVVYNDDTDGDTISHVLVTVEQTAGYRIYDCVFDSSKGAFKVIPVYDAGGINLITNSKSY